MSHYPSIAAGYFLAIAIWFVVFRLKPDLWPKDDEYKFEKPWGEIGYVLLAGVCIILIGQLYVRGIRLPSTGALGPIFESLNQIAIFSPAVGLLFIRKHPPSTAWIRTDRIHWRLPIGLVMAVATLVTYTWVRGGADPFWQVIPRVYAYDNLGFATQVFLEDLIIAMLVVRIGAAIGAPATVALVASLFAAGHIPTMVANGVSFAEFGSLIFDAMLGIAIISVALRSRDIWWLWCVHYAMDMSQFERISGVAS